LNPAVEVRVAIWSVEQTENGAFVVWYSDRGAKPVKCGEGCSVLAPAVRAWVCETAAPFDLVRGAGFGECVRLKPPERVAGRVLFS